MKPESEKKFVRIPSALPYYMAAGALLLWALITPVYKLAFLLIGAAVSVCAYLIGKKLFPGRCEVIEIEKFSGDKDLDEQINLARSLLARFKTVASDPGNADIRESLERITKATEAIIEDVVRDESGRMDAYTFFSYYLPTLDKLITYQQTFAGTGENVTESKRRVKDSLSMIASAFEKQQDRMYKNEAVDIKTDITVMESLLKSEGLIDK